MSDSATHEVLHVLKIHPKGAWGLAFSPDDTRLLVGDAEGTAHVWDVVLGEERLRLEGHLGTVSAVAWSPGGKRWLTGGRHNAHLWDAVAEAEVARFLTATRPVTGTAFFPDGRTAVYACGSSSLRVPDSGAILCVKRPAYLVLIDLVTQQEIRRFEACNGGIGSLQITPDGTGILASHFSPSDYGLTLWDAQSGVARQQIRHRTMVRFLAALVPGSAEALIRRNDQVELWSLETGEFRPGLPEVDYSLSCLAVTPNGRFALTAPLVVRKRGGDYSVTVWELASGRRLGKLTGHRSDIRDLAVSHDGRLAAASSEDGTVRLWDLTTF